MNKNTATSATIKVKEKQKSTRINERAIFLQHEPSNATDSSYVCILLLVLVDRMLLT